MTYCWEVFDQTKCESCEYFIAFKEGNLDLDKVKIKEIVIIDDD